MHRRTSDRHGSSTASVLRRAAALTLALAFLLAQLASQVHRAEKAHRLCAEHGTLEHGHDLDGLSAHEHEHAAVLAEPIDGPTPVPESHAACELAQLLHVPQAGAPAVALAVSTVAPAATAAAPREEVRPREVRGRRESARGPPRAA